MNIFKSLLRGKGWKNVGWKSDEPTEMVVRGFKNGLIKPGDKVLDIGCGFGRNSNFLAGKGANVTAININDEELDYAKKKAKEMGVNVIYLHADATQLPFPDGSFDLLIDGGCTHMIPSSQGQKLAELEAARILKPKGILIYFGFSKKHPGYLNKPKSPQFRDLEDIKEMYGDSFDIVTSKTHRWQPIPGEDTKILEHVGLEIVMEKKFGEVNK